MDSVLSFLSTLGGITGPVGDVLGTLAIFLHMKNAGHITSIFDKVAGVARDVALVAQNVRLNHAALPLAIAQGVAQVAQDTGVPDKIVQQVQSGAGQAAALLPAADAVLQAEAPTVEAHLHTVLGQLGTAALALSQAAERMQATPPAPAPAPAAGG